MNIDSGGTDIIVFSKNEPPNTSVLNNDITDPIQTIIHYLTVLQDLTLMKTSIKQNSKKLLGVSNVSEVQ